jgi:hypothetical protein
LQLVLTDRHVDLVKEKFDLAFRTGLLKDTSVVAHELGRRQLRCFASRVYLRDRGTPLTLPDLRRQRHEGAGRSVLAVVPWRSRCADGAPSTASRSRSRPQREGSARYCRLPGALVVEGLAANQLVEVLFSIRLYFWSLSIIHQIMTTKPTNAIARRTELPTTSSIGVGTAIAIARIKTIIFMSSRPQELRVYLTPLRSQWGACSRPAEPPRRCGCREKGVAEISAMGRRSLFHVPQNQIPRCQRPRNLWRPADQVWPCCSLPWSRRIKRKNIGTSPRRSPLPATKARRTREPMSPISLRSTAADEHNARFWTARLGLTEDCTCPPRRFLVGRSRRPPRGLPPQGHPGIRSRNDVDFCPSPCGTEEMKALKPSRLSRHGSPSQLRQIASSSVVSGVTLAASRAASSAALLSGSATEMATIALAFFFSPRRCPWVA